MARMLQERGVVGMFLPRGEALRTGLIPVEPPALDLFLARGDRCCHRDSLWCCLDCESGGRGSWRARAGAPVW